METISKMLKTQDNWTVTDLRNWWESKYQEGYTYIIQDVWNVTVKPENYTQCQHVSIPSRYLRKNGQPGHRDWAFKTHQELLDFVNFYYKELYKRC